MKQKDKELLFKDICSRLPYKLVCEVKYEEDGKYKKSNMFLSGVFTDEVYFTSDEGSIYSNDYKPYLFPLSSMTEEHQREESNICAGHIIGYESNLIDFYNKYHYDYRGLIPKELAIDATGKNIY
jgi:hypothetical protein